MDVILTTILIFPLKILPKVMHKVISSPNCFDFPLGSFFGKLGDWQIEVGFNGEMVPTYAMADIILRQNWQL